MAHSVSEAAALAVRKSEKSKAAERTPEQILKDIHRNLEARLAVTPDDTRFLMAQYDAVLNVAQTSGSLLEAAQNSIAALQQQIADQQAKLDEFRTVYEQENRRSTVSVRRVDENEQTEAAVTVETTEPIGAPESVAAAAASSVVGPEA